MDEVLAVAREILGYLKQHPDAKDTVEGIARWWLARERAQTLPVVERAVELLLARGYIRETRRSGGPPYYQGNPQALEWLDAKDA